MANQFVVELKNNPGAMADLAEELAARGTSPRSSPRAGSTCARSAAAASATAVT
jgi:hypothetical protein